MELLSRDNFYRNFNTINESYDTEINTRSNISIYYDANKKEYKLKSDDEEIYMKPNELIFNAEVNKITTYIKVQDNLVKNSTANDPKKLDKILMELGVYDLFKEEVKNGWFSSLKEDLLEIGIEEPTVQEIVNLYPNFNKWSNEAKNSFTKLAQMKVQYAISKVDILIHYSTIK